MMGKDKKMGYMGGGMKAAKKKPDMMGWVCLRVA
jgi:hypothetical protein